jgi:hypothetical protein
LVRSQLQKEKRRIIDNGQKNDKNEFRELALYQLTERLVDEIWNKQRFNIDWMFWKVMELWDLTH